MLFIIKSLENLYQQIPRRHNDENVTTIENTISDYEDILMQIEAKNATLEKAVGIYFDTVEEIKNTIKKSKDRKASKKIKDDFFDTAADLFKDTIQELIVLCKTVI